MPRGGNYYKRPHPDIDVHTLGIIILYTTPTIAGVYTRFIDFMQSSWKVPGRRHRYEVGQRALSQ